jgi:transposase-like protein
VQTCIVHLIRNSLAFVTWKDRKAILPSINAIYRAERADRPNPATGLGAGHPIFAFAPVIR